MTIRTIVMLVCIVAFINGCNSLISQQFGTNKLRNVSMDQARKSGLSDADYVELTNAQITGDFIFAPGRNENDKAVVLYPLVDQRQLDSLREGNPVWIKLIGWEKRRPGSIPDTVSIDTRREVYRGLVREPGNRFNKARELNPDKYRLSRNLVYVEMGKEPLEWYWNVAIMLVSFVTFLFLSSKLKR